MSRNIIETVLGAVVLIIAGVFIWFAYSSSTISSTNGYVLTAKFDHIEGTQAGGDVRISGIKVGTILSQELDPKTYQAIVKLSIDKSVQIPTDTVATITSAGLLGDKFLALVPGAEDKMIPPGGEITITQPPVSLEALLGQYVFSNSGGGTGKPGNAAAPSSPSPTPAK